MPLTRRRFLQGAGGVLAAGSLRCGSSGPATPPPTPIVRGPDAAPPAALTGRVLRPGDDGWDDARAVWNGRISAAPQAVVFAASVEDVQNAIAWARHNGVAVRARSGRHSYEGYSVVDGGLVLDVSGLADVSVDAARGRARVGAGAGQLDVYDRLDEADVMVGGGSCATLGIAGLALGGGHGLSARRLGLLCDQVVSVDLVTADGALVTASADASPDLFWALRGGGGGNFGVATAFELAVAPAVEVAIYSVSWPFAELAVVVGAWLGWAPAADPALTSLLILTSTRLHSFGQYAGGTDGLRALLAPLLAAASHSGLTISAASSRDAAHHFAGSEADPHPKFKNGSTYVLAPLPDAAFAVLSAQLAAAPGPANALHLGAMGGAIAEVAADATAFPYRGALCSVQIEAAWSDDDDEARNRAWVQGTRAALAPWTSGAYVNYIDGDLADFGAAYYGANLARLAAVKRQVDPDGFWSFPQAIPV